MWFTSDIEDNDGKVPNNKPSVLQQSSKTTLPPHNQRTNSCATMLQLKQSIMNVQSL